MVEKQSKNGDSGAAVAVTDPGRLRNVVLVGPSGSGKTTLTEALLAASGTVSRAGSIVDGTTVCDHDPAAIRQQRSVSLSVAPVLHNGFKINLIDTPGYADFVGELRAGLRAADAALFVVSAAEGVDPATVAGWQECAAVGMPRAVVIARLDHHRADPEAAIAACQKAFGTGVLPLYLPSRTGNQGLVGLITQRFFDYSRGFPPMIGEPDPADLERMSQARNELIEGVIGESEDETLMDRYLAGEEISEATLIDDLETAVARGAFHPVVPVCAATGVGLAELLDGIVRAFPSPFEHSLPEFTTPDGAPHAGLRTDPDGPLAAEVVRTAVDSYVGRVSLVRVFSGTLRPEHAVHVSGHGLAERGHEDHDSDERVAHLYSPLGANLREVPFCVAGDLCALTKVGSAETGDTVSSPDKPLLMKPWAMPEPLLPVAVIANARSDEDALARNLSRLVAGDPTLRLERNAETNQLVLWCMGEAHADVVLSRLRAGGADIGTEPVRISLRSTFAGPAKGHGRHVKQSGGHGQYAVCDIEVQPLERGSGFEFVDRVVGGAVPHQFIPSVEKGVRAQLQRGLGDGHPVVDVRVTLVDGKAHSVDSSDAAFQTAGALALREAAANSRVLLLEPLDEVAVRLPDEHLGTVLGDLSSRRGRVLGTEADAGGQTVIKAEVPAVELLRYATDLRSLTSGTAMFTRQHAHFEPIPEGAITPRG
jgi:elongation factor G